MGNPLNKEIDLIRSISQVQHQSHQQKEDDIAGTTNRFDSVNLEVKILVL
jgi:hypothetical protein